jgi:heme-degrading monooxygenase HmoA
MQHFRIAQYEVTSGTTDEIADLAQGGMLDIFKVQPGFQAYSILEVDPKTIVSVSIWESHQEAEDAVALAATWVAENIAGRISLQSNTVGDSLFWATAGG